MTRRNDKDEALLDAECARIMAMTPAELDAEFRRRGLDPAVEAQKVRRIIDICVAWFLRSEGRLQ